MQPTNPLQGVQPTGAVRSHIGVTQALGALATAVRACLARWGRGDDEHYLGAAVSLEDFERRQRRLERDGLPSSNIPLP
jgi:hypothetical protein